MPAMKVTPDTAMRARDVSRPHAEQLRWAEDVEASAAAATDVVIRADVVAEAGVATVEVDRGSAGSERLAGMDRLAGAHADMDIPDSESPKSEDRAPGGETKAAQVDGTGRHRVRGVRSPSRRGRPSR
jgi:hypothetical protein